MAFTSVPGQVLARSSEFCGRAVSQKRSPKVTGYPRMMAGFTEREKQSFAKIGKGSQWRESVFIGGFPGGEEAYLNWVNSGAKDNVPDLPDYLQPQPSKDKIEAKKQSGLTELEKSSFAKIGGESKWRENRFVGGFPGGEEAYNAWVEGGAKADVPDLPAYLQPNPSKKAAKKAGLFGFLKDRFGSDDEAAVEEEKEAEAEVQVDPDGPPPESLYEKYYPKETRYLAPFISMVSENDVQKDKISMYMGEVTASAADLYFPKDVQNKAPFITINYTKNLNTSSVSVSMKEVDPLPCTAAPVNPGETVTKLVDGPGGGLKLEFEVEGQGPVNVYSDPRCIENYNSMIQGS